MKRLTINIPLSKKKKALSLIKKMNLREVVSYKTKSLDTNQSTVMISMLVTDTTFDNIVRRFKKELSLGKSIKEGVMTVDETFLICPSIQEKKSQTAHKGKITKTVSEYSKLDRYELSFLILATIIAALGLLMNNFFIVIGAMLIAPLMNPIMSASFSIVKKNKKVLSNAMLYQFKAYFVVVVLSFAIGLVFKNISSPVFSYYFDPYIIYLCLAFAIGVAAALAFVSDKIIGFVGVAVSIALLPPLVIIGLALAFNYMVQVSTALIIFILNIIGMHIGALLSFYTLNHKV